MNVTNSRRKTNQNTNTFQSLLYQQIYFSQIKSKMATNNMSNVHVSPDVLSTVLLLQQGNLFKLQQQILHGIFRSSRPEVFCKKTALKTFAEFTEKHLCSSIQAYNVIKKRLQYRSFPVNFGEFLRTPISKNICERLLLHLKYYTPANSISLY